MSGWAADSKQVMASGPNRKAITLLGKVWTSVKTGCTDTFVTRAVAHMQARSSMTVSIYTHCH